MINLLTFDNLLPSLHSCQNLTNLEKNDGGYHVFPPHRDFKAPSTHIRFHLKKSNFFFTDTASIPTYPMKPINENGTSRKHSPEWNFLKTLFSRVHEDRRKRNFSKTLKSHYQFQATPRNIRNLFKTADGASSMRSRVSYRFQIDSSYTCGRAKTMRKRYEWTRIF